MYTSKHIEITRTLLNAAASLDLMAIDETNSIISTLTEKLKEPCSKLLSQYSEFMTVAEVAFEIKRDPKTINRMLTAGTLLGIRKKKGNLIKKRSVLNWLGE